MALPALQKAWQGGSSGGGAEFVNVIVSGTTPRDTLWAMHTAMTGFFAFPWTVIGSSDSSVAAMDAVDRLVAPANWVLHASGAARSWLVIQNAAIGATFQALIWLDDTTADPNGENLNITCNAGGFGAANGGADGSTTVLPTPSDTTKNFSIDGSDWIGAEGGSPTQKILTCISSTDGECFRAVISQDGTGIPIAGFGVEVPRLPPSAWTTPAVIYLFKSTVASALSCFRWETMADQVTAGEIRANVPISDASGFRIARMVPTMPMFSTVEVIDLQEDERPNPMLYPPTLFGFDVNNRVPSTAQNHGSLFDWYWCNRNVAGAHLVDLDSMPAAGDRTFVCVGDCVWGWLDNGVTDLQYGFLPFKSFAADTTELQHWLGLRYLGPSTSTDIRANSSHQWEFEDTSPVDIGTLATANFDFGAGTDITATTDADFEENTRPIIELGVLNTARMDTAISALQKIPSAKDGTVSFMVGGIARVDSLPGTQAIAWLTSQCATAGDGWLIGVRDSNFAGTDWSYLQFALKENSFGTNLTVNSNNVGFNFGEPFAFLCGLDVAAGEMFCMVSKLGSYNTTAWVDSGDFDSGTLPLSVGKSVLVGADDTFNGQFAQLFSFEWSSTIDAGITQATMDRFAAFCSGNPVPDPPSPFNNFATSTTELQTWLGIRGQLSTDIAEDSSHLWQMENGTSSTDVGTLATANHDLGSANDVTAVTDPDFADNTRTVAKQGVTHVAHLQSSNLAGVIPSAKDGTVSFMVGGIARIDSLPGVDTFAEVVSQLTGSQNGWGLRARNTGNGFDSAYLRFEIIQQNFGSNTFVGTAANTVGVQLGKPFAFLVGLDVAAAEVFIMIDQSAGRDPTYTTTAWVDIGSFGGTTAEEVILGLSNRSAAVDTYEGLVAQLFTFEWSAAIDAGLSQANMDRFISFCETGAAP